METRTLEQLPTTAIAQGTDLLAIQAPGGPVMAIELSRLIGHLGPIDVIKDTQANLYADLAWAAGKLAIVYADADPAKLGYYIKTGAAGAGAWVKSQVFHGIPGDPGGPVADGDYFDIAVSLAGGKWVVEKATPSSGTFPVAGSGEFSGNLRHGPAADTPSATPSVFSSGGSYYNGVNPFSLAALKWRLYEAADYMGLGISALRFNFSISSAAYSFVFGIAGVEKFRIADAQITSAVKLTVPDEAYGVGWNGNSEVPTKNAVYDKIESIGGGLTAEDVRDVIGAALVQGVGIVITVNDPGDTITISRQPSIQTVASAANVTPTFANDQVNITAQAVGLTLANPTGTAVDGHGIAVRIKDNGASRAIAYGTQYRGIGVVLPAATVANKTLYLGMAYNAADAKWDVVAVAQEA